MSLKQKQKQRGSKTLKRGQEHIKQENKTPMMPLKLHCDPNYPWKVSKVTWKSISKLSSSQTTKKYRNKYKRKNHTSIIRKQDEIWSCEDKVCKD